MADISNNETARRREARRRKILNNSEDRLKKVTGCNLVNFKTEEHTGSCVSAPLLNTIAVKDKCVTKSNTRSGGALENSPIAQAGSDVPKALSGSFLAAESKEKGSADIHESSSHSAADIEQNDPIDVALEAPSVSFATNARGSNPVVTGRESLMPSREEEQVSAKKPRTLVAELIYPVVGFILVLLLNSNLGWLFANNIMVPFCLIQSWEWVVNLGKWRPTPRGGMVGAALMLYGVPQQKIHLYISIMDIMRRVGQDFACYIFVFVLGYHFLIGDK